MTRYALDATRAAGIAAWSAAEDYPHPSAAWGSDNELYLTVKASGPSAAGGAADPAKDADFSHWRPALKISALPEGSPAGDDWVPFGDRSAGGRPNARVELRKLLAPLEEAGPAKDDVVVYRDESATGSPAKVVEVQKLLKALGTVEDGKRYVLEGKDGALRLAEGRFRMKRLSTDTEPSGHAVPAKDAAAEAVAGESAWRLPRAGRYFVFVRARGRQRGSSVLGHYFNFSVHQSGGRVAGGGLGRTSYQGSSATGASAASGNFAAGPFWILAGSSGVSVSVLEVAVIEF